MLHDANRPHAGGYARGAPIDGRGVRRRILAATRAVPLTTRLVAMTVALVVVTALAVGLMVFDALRKHVIEQDARRARAEVTRLAGQLALRTVRVGRDLNAMIEAGPVRGFVAASGSLVQQSDGISTATWRGLVEAQFAAHIAAKPDYLSLGLIGPGGREFVHVDAGSRGSAPVVSSVDALEDDPPDPAAVDPLPAGALRTFPIELARADGEVRQPPTPALRLTAPLSASDGTRWGVIMIGLDLQPQFALLRAAAEPDGNLTIVDADGRVLLHVEADPARGDSADPGLRALGEVDPALAAAAGPIDTVTDEGRISRANGRIVAVAAANLAGGQRVLVIRTTSDGTEAALAVVGRSALLGGALAAMVGALFAILLARSTARPIVEMTRGVRNGGDVALLPLDAAAEVGELAHALGSFIERERWHGAMIDNSRDAIVTTDPIGTITRWNFSAAQLFALGGEEAIGRDVEVIVPPGRAAALKAIITGVVAGEIGLAEGRANELEVTRVGPNGGLTDIMMMVSPVRARDRTVIGASIIARDVTDERASEEMLRLSVEHSPAGQLLVGRDRRIILINTEIERRFGYARSELLGKDVDVLLPEAARTPHEEMMEEFFHQPERRAMGADRELMGRRKDGSTFEIEVGLTPVRSRQGLVVLAAVVDISGQKAAQRAILAHTRALERSNADLEQFAYVASHDLQEPLRIVASFTQLLADRYKGHIDERADKYIHFIVDGARRMQALINDLLVYSRVGSETRPPEPVEMGEVVQRAKDQLATRIGESGANVTWDDLPRVLGDREQLVRLIQNLVGNAIKFRSEATPEVTLSAERDGPMWRISVRDNGIGFNESDAGRIFEMFQRLHHRGTYDGTGLGLAICKRIVDQHGGAIGARSTLGTGSVFQVTLPAAAP